MMFVTELNTRKYSGRRLSPTARRMPEPMLYSISPDTPPK